jgi:hypothetical protein
MNKRIFPAILLAAACLLSACGVGEPTAEPTAATTTAATTTAATTTAAVTTAAATTTAAADEPVDESADEPAEDTDAEVFAEVSYVQYSDLEMVEIIELMTWSDAELPGMVEMNDAIFDSVMSRVMDFETTFEESGEDAADYMPGLNVWGYSISDENYIQIFNTLLEYPTYGTTGELFGFVYDIENDDYITLEECLALEDYSVSDMEAEILTLYADNNPDIYVDGVYLKAFSLMPDPDGDYMPSFLCEIERTTPEAGEPYKSFFIYSIVDEDVWELNSDQLFDPYSVDQYEEPLHGQEGWAEYYADILD